jgi:mediator of RNA polymerase II transcription subunit 14
MISHATDVKMLIQRRIKYSSVEMLNQSLPPSMKLPALWMCLSDILNGRGSKKAWAADYVQVMFKGLTKPPRKSKLAIQDAANAQEAGLKPPRQELLSIYADARFKVADRSKFSLLKGNVEQDVAFNPRLGVFALRLKAEVGSTLLDDLASRIHAIERLVDCVDAIRRSSTDIQCETIALREVVFTYSDAIGRVVGTTAEANIKRWKASLDLRGDKIKLSLEKDNPHLRVLDSFNKLLNSDLGFTKVPQYLAFTLPVLKALDAIEESWRQMDAKDQGRAEIFSGYLDWYTIRYTVPTANKNASKLYHISIRLKHRRGMPWWHVAREEPEPNSNPDDELKPVLAKVWGKEDKTWQSFGDSASCEANETVNSLLGAVDTAVQQLALRSFSSSPSLSRKTQPTLKMKQQPTPKMNNMKMQVPNRVRPVQKPENVVITLDD